MGHLVLTQVKDQGLARGGGRGLQQAGDGDFKAFASNFCPSVQLDF
ncbi:MAG: hypothetical protein ACK4MZ_10030 [Thermomonas haemolytica]